MSDVALVPVMIPQALRDDIRKLAETAGRNEAALLGQLVEHYVASQAEWTTAIANYRADIAAGHLIDHEAAMADVDAAIEASSHRRPA